MGSLTHFRLSDEFVKHFPVFIETGYGDGNGLAYAACHAFDMLFSFEIWPDAVTRGRERFRHDRRISIGLGDSADLLAYQLKDHGPQSRTNRPVFFWLDAHFPGADCDGQPYDAEPDLRLRLPLPRELEVIREARPKGDYCILMDDLGHYPMINDTLDLFAPTHNIYRVLDYGMLMPPGAPSPEYVG